MEAGGEEGAVMLGRGGVWRCFSASLNPRPKTQVRLNPSQLVSRTDLLLDSTIQAHTAARVLADGGGRARAGRDAREE